jgi:hypothetical protein
MGNALAWHRKIAHRIHVNASETQIASNRAGKADARITVVVFAVECAQKNVAQYPKFTIRARLGKATPTTPARILEFMIKYKYSIYSLQKIRKIPFILPQKRNPYSLAQIVCHLI